MITTLLVQDETNKRPLKDKISSEHKDWNVIEAQDLFEAKSRLKDGDVDALAVVAELPALDCVELVESLKSTKPDANIYIIIKDAVNSDLSRSIERGFIKA